MSKDWQEQNSLEDIMFANDYEQAEELLANDFQYYLADAIALAQGYEVRNSMLKERVECLAGGRPSQEKFAALGELLYQWAEEEALAEVERNNSPLPRLG
tara:strand:- start:3448 stop:3747 length:300 start_codon:yes stop_codon:yes gene_type:complete